MVLAWLSIPFSPSFMSFISFLTDSLAGSSGPVAHPPHDEAPGGGHARWARAPRDRRNSEQGGASLPLPCVSFRQMRRVTRSSSVDDVLLCGMMRYLCEGVDKEIMRMIVSFI